MGYTDDLPLEGMLRDVTAFQIIGGSDAMMKLLIAYEAMGKMVIPGGLALYMGEKASGIG